MELRIAYNRLFLGDAELVEWSCAQSHCPAHFHRILCASLSPNGRFIVSMDAGSQLKLWHLGKSRLEQRIYETILGGPDATVVAINDRLSRIAVVQGSGVSILTSSGWMTFRIGGSVQMTSESPVIAMVWRDEDNLVCRDATDKETVITNVPPWLVSQK